VQYSSDVIGVVVGFAWVDRRAAISITKHPGWGNCAVAYCALVGELENIGILTLCRVVDDKGWIGLWKYFDNDLIRVPAGFIADHQ